MTFNLLYTDMVNQYTWILASLIIGLKTIQNGSTPTLEEKNQARGMQHQQMTNRVPVC